MLVETYSFAHCQLDPIKATQRYDHKRSCADVFAGAEASDTNIPKENPQIKFSFEKSQTTVPKQRQIPNASFNR